MNGPVPGRIPCVLAAGVVGYRCGGHLRAWGRAVDCRGVDRCDFVAASPDVAPAVDAVPRAVAALVAWLANEIGRLVSVVAKDVVCPAPWLAAGAGQVALSDVPAPGAISRVPCPLARVAHRPKPWLSEGKTEVPW